MKSKAMEVILELVEAFAVGIFMGLASSEMS